MLCSFVSQLGIALGITVRRCRTLNLDIHQLAAIAAQLTNEVVDGQYVDGVVSQLSRTNLEGQLQVAGSLTQLGLGLFVVTLIEFDVFAGKANIQHLPRLTAVTGAFLGVVVIIDMGIVFQTKVRHPLVTTFGVGLGEGCLPQE